MAKLKEAKKLRKLRVRLLEEYFPFRNLIERGRNQESVPIEEALTEKELEEFDATIWRNVELMNSDLSDMTDEAREDFLDGLRESIRSGFEVRHEQAKRQSELAEKRHSAEREASAHARILAGVFREMKPTERIGEGAVYVAAGLKSEGFKAPGDPTLRKWIRDLFPDELRRPGRTRNK